MKINKAYLPDYDANGDIKYSQDCNRSYSNHFNGQANNFGTPRSREEMKNNLTESDQLDGGFTWREKL